MGSGDSVSASRLAPLQRRGSLGFLDFLQPVLRRSLLERALRMTSDALAERRGGAAGGGSGGGKPAAGGGDANEAAASSAAGARADGDAGADAGAGAGDVLDDEPLGGDAARRSPAHRAPARDRRAGSSASSGSVASAGNVLFPEPAPR